MYWIRWNLREEAKSFPPSDVCPISELYLIMKIIIWNCRGTLKPSFQRHVRELIRSHNPTILVVMEIRIGGDRAREITNRLSFDGVIHTEIIGYAGGLWILRNLITALANTE